MTEPEDVGSAAFTNICFLTNAFCFVLGNKKIREKKKKKALV